MSAKSYFVESQLEIRARRPGITSNSRTKPWAKRATNKATRKAEQSRLDSDLQALCSTGMPIQGLSTAELDALADRFIVLAAPAPAMVAEDDPFDDEGQLDLRTEGDLPTELQGGLPDWMLSSLDAAKGNAFDYLSLFETRQVPTARAMRAASGYLAEETEAFSL
ncbi:hypothetical protein ACOTC5_31220 [Achromobacter xylosoxidans]